MLLSLKCLIQKCLNSFFSEEYRLLGCYAVLLLEKPTFWRNIYSHIVFLCSVLRLLVTANVPSALILVTLMMEVIYFSEMSFLTRST
jgi:hypothetical protein